MKTLTTILIACSLATTAFSSPIKMKFTILDEAGNRVKDASVHLYHGNQKEVITENTSGSVTVGLDYDGYYTIEIVKEHFVSKRISINTYIGDNPLMLDKFKFYVELERASKYAGFESADAVLDYPTAHLEYDPIDGVFDYSKPYWHNSLRHITDLRKQVYMYRQEADRNTMVSAH